MDNNPTTPQTPTHPAQPGQPFVAAGPDPNAGTNPSPTPSVAPSPAPTLEAPAAPVSPVAPTATPVPQPAAMPQPAPQPATPVKKKSHFGAILAIIIAAILVLGGGGFALWYFLLYSNPEKVVADATEHFFSASNVRLDGGFSIRAKQEGYEERESTVLFNLKSSSPFLPNSSEASLLVTNQDDYNDFSINLKAGSVFLADGKLYFKVDELTKAVEEIISAVSAGTDSSVIDFISSFTDEVEGDWWEIDPTKLISDMPETGIWKQLNASSSEAQTLIDIYQCATSVLSKNPLPDLGALYQDNRFLKITKTNNTHTDAKFGESWYKVDFDTEKLAAFLNGIGDTTQVKDLLGCVNSQKSALGLSKNLTAKDLGFGRFKASDFDKKLERLNPEILLRITDWGHQLNAIEIHIEQTEDSYDVYNYKECDLNYIYDDCDYTDCGLDYIPTNCQHADYHLTQNLDLGFVIDYTEVVVTAPSEYRPITDLYAKVEDLNLQAAYQSYLEYADDSDGTPVLSYEEFRALVNGNDNLYDVIYQLNGLS